MENTISKIQCSGCGRFFVGASVHDAHRTGDYSTRTSRHCLTEDEMRGAGLDCEKKNVRIIVAGKAHFEEHDVWFDAKDRERMKGYFSPVQQEEPVEASS
jgi:hypothetical protein